jgi:hypothetical protein
MELHLHGGPAVVRATLAALADLPDFRVARPGVEPRPPHRPNPSPAHTQQTNGISTLVCMRMEALRGHGLVLPHFRLAHGVPDHGYQQPKSKHCPPSQTVSPCLALPSLHSRQQQC